MQAAAWSKTIPSPEPRHTRLRNRVLLEDQIVAVSAPGPLQRPGTAAGGPDNQVMINRWGPRYARIKPPGHRVNSGIGSRMRFVPRVVSR